jgi:hypothetical protein
MRVCVTQLDKVKLSDGLAGICPGYFPQYLINAILEGHAQPTFPEEMIMELDLDSKRLMDENSQ